MKSRAESASAEPLGTVFELLVAGGDERLHLDPGTGLNPYGCSLLPRDGVLDLGSCTMSSMSPLSLASVARLHRRLSRALAAGALEAAIEDACESLRADLLAALEIDCLPGVQAVLTPSGTDAELLPPALAACRSKRRICNIMVGATEAGSGSALAAGGLHPKDLTPHGGRRGAGTAIAGGLGARVSVAKVAVREPDGGLRPLAAVDQEVEAIAEEASRRGETVIVHRMAHSKTGVFAPSLGCLRRLRRRHDPERLLVFVDAAQARVGASSIQRHLSDGDIVLLTGSKFYGGPPFSSVVLVPAVAHPPDLPASPIPEGLGDYLSACDIPPRWSRMRSLCRRRHNLGLLLRWTAALAEIRAYRCLPRAVQREIIAAFGDSVRARLSTAAILEGVPPRDAAPLAGEAEPQEMLPTVFSFELARRSGRDRPLGVSDLRPIATHLGAGMAALGGGFHLGQPVRLGTRDGDERAVLRVAIGAPLVRRVAEDAALGPRLCDRIAWLDAQVDELSTRLQTVLDERPAATAGGGVS